MHNIYPYTIFVSIFLSFPHNLYKSPMINAFCINTYYKLWVQILRILVYKTTFILHHKLLQQKYSFNFFHFFSFFIIFHNKLRFRYKTIKVTVSLLYAQETFYRASFYMKRPFWTYSTSCFWLRNFLSLFSSFVLFAIYT